MANMPWFRYYSEICRDRKLIMAARAAGTSKTEMIGAWSVILCLANDAPIRGKLLVTLQERFTVTDIETELELDEEKTEKILAALLRYEMLEQDEDGIYWVKNWGKRQFESDNSTPRVKKHRQGMGKLPDETLQKRYSNAPETETETETEKILVDEKIDDPTHLIKNPGAYKALLANEERRRNGGIDLSWLQESLRPLATAFITASNIQPGRDKDRWRMTLLDQFECGIKVDTIPKAVKKARHDEMTIKDPGSITAFAKDIQAKRKDDEVFTEKW